MEKSWKSLLDSKIDFKIETGIKSADTKKRFLMPVFVFLTKMAQFPASVAQLALLNEGLIILKLK